MKFEKLYTLTEVESILGLTHRTLLEWVKLKKLPAVKVGGKWKVKESDLQKIVNRGTAINNK